MADSSDLETLYSPSRWSKRLSPDVIVGKHIEVVKEASEKTKNSIPNELNITYGPGEKQKYDVFGTDLEDGCPIFIFIHGGYWQEESITKDCYWFIADNLYKNKVKSIFVGYDLCPKVTFPELIDEIDSALVHCFDYAKTHGTRSMYLAGHSAGAQLAATVFTNLVKNLDENSKSMIRAAFLISGVYNLIPLIGTTNNISLKLDETLAKQLSPQHQQISKNGWKLYVIVASDESPAFIEQSREFYEKLLKHNVTSELDMLTNCDHFNIIECMSEDNFKLNEIILNEIKQRS